MIFIMKNKAINLMIGDLIKIAFYDGTWRCVCVDELRYLDDEDSDTIHIGYKDMYSERHSYISCDDSDEDIRGIEITEDFLTKNGFVGDGYFILDVGDNKYYAYYPYEHRLTLYYEGINEWDNHSRVKDVLFRCHCRYVHELQHAFKMWDDFASLADKLVV